MKGGAKGKFGGKIMWRRMLFYRRVSHTQSYVAITHILSLLQIGGQTSAASVLRILCWG